MPCADWMPRSSAAAHLAKLQRAPGQEGQRQPHGEGRLQVVCTHSAGLVSEGSKPLRCRAACLRSAWAGQRDTDPGTASSMREPACRWEPHNLHAAASNMPLVSRRSHTPPASYQPPASEAPLGAISARAESPLQGMRLSAGSLPERCASKKRYELSSTCTRAHTFSSSQACRGARVRAEHGGFKERRGGQRCSS